MVIKRIIETDDRAGRFINEAFTDYFNEIVIKRDRRMFEMVKQELGWK